MPPVVLTIAGSDSSCGAGIQADLKTIGALGCHGLTAVTCVVAEAPGKVISIQPVRAGVVRDQLEVLLANYPVGAVKTGMLYSPTLIRTVAEVLAGLKNPPPLVVDPVLVATSGDALARTGAVSAYKSLFLLATLVTPNLDELTILTGGGKQITTLDGMRAAGKRLTAEFGIAVLAKGGHLGGSSATDLLIQPEGGEQRYDASFVRGLPRGGSHGTGCTYSAAIAAGLASGLPLSDAVGQAKQFITRALAGAFRWGSGSRRIAALDQVQLRGK